MTPDPSATDSPLRVLVLAPTGRDAEVIVQTLKGADMVAEACSAMSELCRQIAAGAGAALVTGEALSGPGQQALEETLRAQAEWSDFPLIIMTSKHRERGPGWTFARSSTVSYALILERPVHADTLASAVRSALRSRSRQYQVRDELAERQRAEEALRESEARFREMADGLSLIVWVHDANGRQELVNETFCEFFGVSREEMTDGKWQILMHPDDAAAYISEFEACAREQRPFHAEVRVKCADGRWRLIESWARPRFSPAGDFRGFVGTSADITERNRAEDALRESEARLRESDDRKDEFLAMLGHELRNPLAAIRNATELIKRIQEEAPRLGRIHGVLDRQSAHMAHLIDGLLEVSRISRGKIHLDQEVLDLRAVIESIVTDRAAEAEARRLALQEDLPPEPLWTFADQVRLAQVFDNLVGNALKFTREPGSVTVMLHQEDGLAAIRVRDTGAGIRPELLPYIFDPFQQETQDSAHDAGGLGLGLAVAKGLVELHGGSIEVHSGGPGTGAEFVVRLPLTSSPRTVQEEEQRTEVSPQHILLVEDNEDAAGTLHDLLELEGHEVAVVSNGTEALESLRRQLADIVLCDIGLPGMSGYELARVIREDASLSRIPLVALTGYGQPEDHRRAVEAGFDVHLTKPVDLQKVQDALSRLVLRK